MIRVLIDIGWVLAAFAGMEFIAWAAHKYVMHTFGWVLHRDHHQPTGRPFQRNDLFALIFAIPSWLFMQFGVMAGCDYRLYIGIGILLYGIAYFLAHEYLIHDRWHNRGKIGNWYLRGLARAHFAHHKHKGKEDGECFGMLVVPFKYFRRTTANEA
ncbi:MAG: sterol desaturase family protein [Flavobacteriales bacterium]|nr:sterol desaturase family protein [Flavobacteriales bacterium]MCB9168477.1 sterol desaturase family protein [Flavobacteriales bacterium]MCB9170106.1 sterol desaturase family protein [Flavobacteriales bacterium]